MSATEPQAPQASQDQARPFALAGVSMRDLLASCAAARAVSTPPRVPDHVERSVGRPKAA
ncbi:hypothetical protein JCM4814A_21420 [Streptomyces phaeofaciens JCM 4814]|uniref:Uncharacterized protein n=1 Tax=Streptomyces phaeofaciens TaxID=68254 RepID=A0A918M1N8_9ACTN|nr:hypothetical protein [Streptomyces phaeofaciens]GGT94857.1 hypothetical protein GCM10010226_85730 [Streptomyces phaeofaciens]